MTTTQEAMTDLAKISSSPSAEMTTHFRPNDGEEENGERNISKDV